MIDRMRSDWAELLSHGKQGQKLVGAGPLHLYYGVDSLGRAVFFLASDTQSAAPTLGEAVRVEHGQRDDSQWTVVLTLLEDALLETFMGICIELARRTSSATSERAALNAFDRMVHEWRAILSLGSNKRLSRTALRGAVAELRYLLLVAELHGLADAVNGWTGPYRAPNDFRFAGGQVREIKAIQPGATTIHVASVEQLDVPSTDDLELILLTLNDVPSKNSSSFTLIDLVDQVLEGLGEDHATKVSFRNKLELLAIDTSDSFYSEKHFEAGSVKAFAVKNDFPRLRADVIPIGILRTKYELEIAAFADYEIESK